MGVVELSACSWAVRRGKIKEGNAYRLGKALGETEKKSVFSQVVSLGATNSSWRGRSRSQRQQPRVSAAARMAR